MHLLIVGIANVNNFELWNSVGDIPFPITFNKYNECKHYIGYIGTYHDYNYNITTYNLWYMLYHDEKNKFIGKLSDWNYNNLNFMEEEPKYKKFKSACGRLWQKFRDRPFTENCRRIGLYINHKIHGEYYDW